MISQGFLKPPTNYTGSKDRLMNQLLTIFPHPNGVDKFYDLFAGGLAVSINCCYDKVIANDIITPLIEFYINLQRAGQTKTVEDEILKILESKIDKDSQEEFVKLRAEFNQTKDPYQFFSLVSSCTNNLMRFNKKFEFNQTWGKRAINESTIQKIRKYCHALSTKNIEFTNLSFVDLLAINPPKKNDFVYFDPPYIGTEAGYNAFWSKELENQLYDTIDDLDARGIRFAFSGVSIHKGVPNPFMERLSKYTVMNLSYDYEKVARRKNVGDSQEILVVNYY
jgi:DNA adenine methylase Dam